MIRYELLRILRSRKWQYLVPLALLLYVYCSGLQSYSVTGGDISARLQELQIQAAAVLASFLFLSILYLIAWEGEPPLSCEAGSAVAVPDSCRCAWYWCVYSAAKNILIAYSSLSVMYAAAVSDRLSLWLL